MREEDKNDAEKLIKHLQENANIFKKSDYGLFPWLQTDKGKRSRIIHEFSSRGVFDKECVKTGKPKLDEKGWDYFEDKKDNIEYNFGDNTVFQSQINGSNLNQESLKNLTNSNINTRTAQKAKPQQSPLINQANISKEGKSKSNIWNWISKHYWYLVMPLTTILLGFIIWEYIKHYF